MIYFRNLFFLLPLIVLSSCFEIIEEINLNPNGSGILSLTINASQSKGQLDKIMAKDSIYNIKVPQRKEIDASINELTGKLKGMKGISNVIVARDYQNYILVVKCTFANTNALNSAINNIWLLSDKNAPTNTVYCSYANNIFKRNFNYELIKNLKDELGAQEKDILSKSNYTTVYRFQNEIANYTNTGATLSKSKKAIILKNNILDIVTGKRNIQNEIKLKQ